MPEKPAYSRSIYNQFFGSQDPDVVSWRDNVLEKLYARGIVPEYIVRGEDSADPVDADYVSFWTSISTYFAWVVIAARKFAGIENDPNLLYDYLLDKGMAVRPNFNLTEMQVVMTNLYDEFRKRGTKYVFEKANGYIPTTSDMAGIHNLTGDNNIDGEFIRAVDKLYYDELMYNI